VAGYREFLAWMQASALGVFMRESSYWTYAFVNLSHILGVAVLFGSILILDLHLVGVLRRRAPLAAVSRVTLPVAKAGFALAATTGVALLCTNATEYVDNPFLVIKFPAIALGLANAAVVGRLRAWRVRDERDLTRGEERQLAVMGGVSLASWLTAVTAGRMIGYW
jgi:hypothetical protein